MDIPPVSMSLPPVSRASRVRYFVKDLAASLQFCTEVFGFVVSGQDADVAYLRGIEEACHHSVVLMQTDGEPAAECVGMRVASEADLRRAKEYLPSVGGTAEFVTLPYQGLSLLTTFGAGAPPIELCSGMPILPRCLNNFHAQKSGRVLRLDHYQCVVADVPAMFSRCMELGFRPSKCTTHVDTGQILSAFLTRKSNPHDLVIGQAAGPRLHHSSSVVSDLQAMFRAADIAGNLGYGRQVRTDCVHVLTLPL